MMFKSKITALFFCITLTAASQNWQSVGGGANNAVLCVYGDPANNELYAAGYFDSIGGIPANYIAKWNGSTWNSLGSGFKTGNFGWHGLTMYRGKIVAAGQTFSFANFHIATWDGTQWDSIGYDFLDPGFQGVAAINNELYAFGTFGVINSINYNGIAKYDTISGSWVSLGFPYVMTFGDPATIRCVSFYHGKLYVGGLFLDGTSTTTANIACYDGSTWDIVGAGITGFADDVFDLEVYQDDLYAAGAFSLSSGNPGNKIAQWNDTVWRDVGGGVTSTGQIHDLLLYNGKLLAGGSFSNIGGIPANYIASWDGTNWCGYGTDMYSAPPTSLATTSGELYLATNSIWDSIDVNSIAEWAGGSFVDSCGHISVGINETEISQRLLHIYPNPSSNNITIEFDLLKQEMICFEIRNVLGQIVYTKTEQFLGGKQSIEIDINDFPNGVYFVHLQNGNRIGSAKLIKN
jgi:hypothetical protein